ncbi:MAG: hypothetical protein JNM91_06525, partial [Flavobacteriales bacterium]|nr:hypothetical protein [Flavobacteriales bacterium]
MKHPPGRRLLAAMGLSAAMAFTASAQSYCPSDGGSGNTFNINRIQFAGVDNVSGDNNGYGDFTGQTASVELGTAYPITLEPNGPFFLRYRWRVWIDWNQDGTFSTAERVLQQTGFGTETASIAVPTDALPGTTRMRVNMSAFAYQGACASWTLGEVEDYSVSIPSACAADAGTLSGGGDVCNTTGDVVLTATPNGDSNTPDGYSLAYVLTSGTDLVIQQLGAEPSFTVSGGGL